MADRAAGHDTLRWNYSLIFSSGISASTANQLASAGLVLPFLYLALDAPVFFVALLLPFMTASQLTAELLAAPFMKESRRAKVSVIWPTLLTAAAFAVVAVSVEGVPEAAIVAIFIACAVVLGFCKGIKNVGYGQLFGMVVPSHRRGWFTFSQATIAGAVAIVIAWLTKDLLAADTPFQRHVIVLWVGIAALVVAGVFIIGMRHIGEVIASSGDAPPQEPVPGADDHNDGRRIGILRKVDGAHIGEELARGLRTGMSYVWFRRYMVARVLFLSVALAAPFYTIHAASFHKGTPHGLTALVIAASAGIAVGAPLWARVSKHSNRLVMIAGSFIAAASAALALLLDFTGLVTDIWLYAGVVLILSIGASGIASCGYLYLIDMTSDSERPCLLAFTDVAVGIAAIIGSSVLGYVAHVNNPTVPLMVLLALNLVAGFFAMSLVDHARAGDEPPDIAGREGGSPRRASA